MITFVDALWMAKFSSWFVFVCPGHLCGDLPVRYPVTFKMTSYSLGVWRSQSWEAWDQCPSKGQRCHINPSCQKCINTSPLAQHSRAQQRPRISGTKIFNYLPSCECFYRHLILQDYHNFFFNNQPWVFGGRWLCQRKSNHQPDKSSPEKVREKKSQSSPLLPKHLLFLGDCLQLQSKCD